MSLERVEAHYLLFFLFISQSRISSHNTFEELLSCFNIYILSAPLSIHSVFPSLAKRLSVSFHLDFSLRLVSRLSLLSCYKPFYVSFSITSPLLSLLLHLSIFPFYLTFFLVFLFLSMIIVPFHLSLKFSHSQSSQNLKPFCIKI